MSIFFAPPKREALDGLAAAGVARAIFGLAAEPRDKVLPRLDALAALDTSRRRFREPGDVHVEPDAAFGANGGLARALRRCDSRDFLEPAL